MQIKNFIFTASLAATAKALPATQSNTFNLITIHSDSDVQYASFNAGKSSIFAGLASQNASCARPEVQVATFYLKTRPSTSMATLLPHRSFTLIGLEWGKIGFTTGAQPAPKNAERGGWAIKDSHLQFAGNDLFACPNSIDNSWSIWASAGVRNPGGNSDCVGIAARVEENSNPNGCLYTE